MGFIVLEGGEMTAPREIRVTQWAQHCCDTRVEERGEAKGADMERCLGVGRGDIRFKDSAVKLSKGAVKPD